MSAHLKATRDTLNSMWQRTMDVQEKIVDALNANTLRKPLTPELTCGIEDLINTMQYLHSELLQSNNKSRAKAKAKARDGE